MKLFEGSLRAFSLPDIFMLLSFTKKHGGLHLACNGSDGVVFFAEGQITGASADSARQPLARRLIGAGVVDDDSLRAAVETSVQAKGIGVAKALLDNGAIDEALLCQAVTDQAVDAVFDLLSWRDGVFAFVMDEANPDDVGVTLGVESVVSDADARQTTWEAVSKLVPSTKAVLAMPIVLPANPDVSREEWSLLAFVDGRRTVGELVDLTGSGQYAVVSLLAGMVGRGLLEVREDGDTDHVGIVLRRQGLLAPLEGVPFTPISAPAPVEPLPPVESPGWLNETPPDDGPADEPPDLPAEEWEPTEAVAPNPTEPAELEYHAEPGTFVPAEFLPRHAPAAPTYGEPSYGEPSYGDLGGDADLVDAPSGGVGEPGMLGGAHVPGDVVPPRPEPFLPRRQADFDDGAHAVSAGHPLPMHAGGVSGDVIGATAIAIDPEVAAVIERDPSVNRSLMLRLIAGVRGL